MQESGERESVGGRKGLGTRVSGHSASLTLCACRCHSLLCSTMMHRHHYDFLYMRAHLYTHVASVACVCGGWVSVCACVPVFVFVYNFPHINMHMGALGVSPYQLAYPFIATARCVWVCEYNYVCVCACGVYWYYFIYFFRIFAMFSLHSCVWVFSWQAQPGLAYANRLLIQLNALTWFSINFKYGHDFYDRSINADAIKILKYTAKWHILWLNNCDWTMNEN